MPEKLMNIAEVATYLKVSEDEVKRLVDKGEIPAYRIGGSFLRFRKEQLDAIMSEISLIEKEDTERMPAPADSRAKSTHPYTELEKEIKRKEPVTRQYDYTPFERIKDFFYFNDFYIVSFITIGALLYFIFKSA